MKAGKFVSQYSASETSHSAFSQLNVAGFAQPSGDDIQLLPERPQPWSEIVPSQEFQDAYQDWGNDARTILRHVENPLRYSVHTVDPPLENYVKGRVVILGDAVNFLNHICGTAEIMY